MAAWKEVADDVTLLLLNTEGDENMSKTKRFHEAIGLEDQSKATFVDALFLDDEPEAFKQFQQQYIPHVAVLAPDGVLIGHRVKPPKAAIDLATSTRA